MERIKHAIKSGLAHLGVEIHRRRPFGSDVFRDIRNILGDDSQMVAFDVGANVGQTTLAFEREFRSARIHSFEPNPEAYALLTKHVSGHRLITTHPIALGSRCEDRAMHITKSNLTSSLLPISQTATRFLGDLVHEAGQAKVPVSSLDEFVAKENIGHVDLLKLDVQGFEIEVLRGAAVSLRNNHISTILTEVTFVKLYEDQAYFHDVYGELIRHNYQLVGLYHGDYRAGPYLAWCDALFVNPEAIKNRA